MEDNLTLLWGSGRLADQQLPAIERVPHHLAHAALAYHTSGFTEASVLVADGQGEDVSTTFWHGRGTSLTEVARFPVSDSLGFFYTAVTRYLGFSPGSSGKTMGLAPMGQITYDFPELTILPGGYRVSAVGDSKAERMRWWLTRLTGIFGPSPRRSFATNPATGRLETSLTLLPHHADAAASAQAALERTLTHLAGSAMTSTGSLNLVMSGGVALNCSTNGRLRRRVGSGDLYVSGAAHDGGTALGAALAVAATADDLPKPSRLRDLFLGPKFDVDPTVDMEAYSERP